ncbi:contact-dependent growth inhibition system immunity protein [Biostraticola tofi]|uniref:Uncharacterized protein n=1 Tax=Biostraticola tofi TaxID=466109 RepID=A0A4V2W387_9GAMM|nr:contact-dependent growth inhibition system immunity protein [Biostraticola tofi]TCV90999.1 hypothetical protein EDC52_1255 [Biostraticola tofi]
MISFRKLIGNINVIKDQKKQSPLELWFEGVIDISIEDLSVEDLCRAVRQRLCVDQLMPRILKVLTEDPLAGEYYDGELISALVQIEVKDLMEHKNTFNQIRVLIN